jgi:hypothetical protein
MKKKHKKITLILGGQRAPLQCLKLSVTPYFHFLRLSLLIKIIRSKFGFFNSQNEDNFERIWFKYDFSFHSNRQP